MLPLVASMLWLAKAWEKLQLVVLSAVNGFRSRYASEGNEQLSFAVISAVR